MFIASRKPQLRKRTAHRRSGCRPWVPGSLLPRHCLGSSPRSQCRIVLSISPYQNQSCLSCHTLDCRAELPDRSTKCRRLRLSRCIHCLTRTTKPRSPLRRLYLRAAPCKRELALWTSRPFGFGHLVQFVSAEWRTQKEKQRLKLEPLWSP